MSPATRRQLAVAAFLCLFGSDPAPAAERSPPPAHDAVAQFYRGKTITIVSGEAVGGPYDAYSRLLARYLGNHLPGRPNVVVRTKLGAGSNLAAADVARIETKDGTYIAATISAQPIFPVLQGAAGLNYDPSRMNYLGSVGNDGGFCMVRSDSPATNFAGVLKTRVLMGATSASAESGMTLTLLDKLLGAKFKMIAGYPGESDVVLAMQKGEINGMCGMGWLGLSSQYPNLRSNAFKVIVQLGAKGLPQLDRQGVPLAISFARSDDQRRILEIVYSQQVFAHPYFVAAGTPDDRVRALRRAFMETWRDPDLVRDATKMNLDVHTTSGEEIQAILQKIYASPPTLLQSVKQAIRAN